MAFVNLPENMLVTFSGTPFEQRFPPGGVGDPAAFIDAKGVVVRTTRTPFSDEAAAECKRNCFARSLGNG